MTPEAQAGRKLLLTFFALVFGPSIAYYIVSAVARPAVFSLGPILGLLVQAALCFMLYKGDAVVKWLTIVATGLRVIFGCLMIPTLPMGGEMVFVVVSAAIQACFVGTLLFSSSIEAFFQYQREQLKF